MCYYNYIINNKQKQNNTNPEQIFKQYTTLHMEAENF